MLDLRFPSGLFFLLVGAILMVIGAVMPEYRAALTTANVNLYAGLAMGAFGGILLWLARRAS
jgi:hypothetical protein